MRDLELRHGVKIQLAKGEGRLTLAGVHPDAVARAEAEIRGICEAYLAEISIPVAVSGTVSNLTIRVDVRAEGRVIGAGGGVVRDVEARTGARVRVNKGTGECVISAVDRAACDAAAAEIRAIADAVDRDRDRDGANIDENRGGVRAPRPGEIERRVSVRRRGGCVVGPGGSTIRRLCEETGCDARVVRETEEFVAVGAPDRVAAAVAACEGILAARPYAPGELDGSNGAGADGFDGGEDSVTERVPCPHQAGVLIGPRGATIREIRDATGANVAIRGGPRDGGERGRRRASSSARPTASRRPRRGSSNSSRRKRRGSGERRGSCPRGVSSGDRGSGGGRARRGVPSPGERVPVRGGRVPGGGRVPNPAFPAVRARAAVAIGGGASAPLPGVPPGDGGGDPHDGGVRPASAPGSGAAPGDFARRGRSAAAAAGMTG